MIIFCSADIFLATSLITCDKTLVAVDRSNPQKVLFTFNRDDDFDQILEAYWKDELKLPIRSFCNNLKMLKSRIYSDGYADNTNKIE